MLNSSEKKVQYKNIFEEILCELEYIVNIVIVVDKPKKHERHTKINSSVSLSSWIPQNISRVVMI